MGPRTIAGRFWWEPCEYPNSTAPSLQRVRNVESRFPWRNGVGIAVRKPRSRDAWAVGVWTGRAPQSVDEDGPMLTFREI